MRLQQEKLNREKALEEAKWRFDHGEAPSDEAVKEVVRKEKKKLLLQEMAEIREEEFRLAQSQNLLKTAAEPRPSAYIPDDIGIPKPYGNFAPFKPSELGTNMRHIKPPQPKTIEI